MALAASALTTLSAALDELDLVSDGGAQDARLERWISSASDFIARACHRSFERADSVVEDVPAFGTAYLLVSRTPILSVTSITYRGSLISSADYSVTEAEAGRIYRAAGWPWSASRLPSITWPPVPGSEAPIVRVTYNGGWVTPQQVALGAFATRTLPHDLEDACLAMVATRYARRGADLRVKSESLLSHSVTYADGEEGGMLPQVVRDVVERYARVHNA